MQWQIKRGSIQPGDNDLAERQLGYWTDPNYLFIGVKNEDRDVIEAAHINFLQDMYNTQLTNVTTGGGQQITPHPKFKNTFFVRTTGANQYAEFRIDNLLRYRLTRVSNNDYGNTFYQNNLYSVTGTVSTQCRSANCGQIDFAGDGPGRNGVQNITTTGSTSFLQGQQGFRAYTQCGIDIIVNPNETNLDNVKFYHIEIMGIPCYNASGSTGPTAAIVKVVKGVSTIWDTLDI